jgi:hypothetical protein
MFHPFHGLAIQNILWACHLTAVNSAGQKMASSEECRLCWCKDLDDLEDEDKHIAAGNAGPGRILMFEMFKIEA